MDTIYTGHGKYTFFCPWFRLQKEKKIGAPVFRSMEDIAPVILGGRWPILLRRPPHPRPRPQFSVFCGESRAAVCHVAKYIHT